MIKPFTHKGLEKFYESGGTKGIQADHANKPGMQLAALDTAQSVEDMDIPGYLLHQLTGDRRGTWTITVNANWRLTFEEMALRLSRSLGRSPVSWLAMQDSYDLWQAKKKGKLGKIKRITFAASKQGVADGQNSRLAHFASEHSVKHLN